MHLSTFDEDGFVWSTQQDLDSHDDIVQIYIYIYIYIYNKWLDMYYNKNSPVEMIIFNSVSISHTGSH
jgi:hypothetical protein